MATKTKAKGSIVGTTHSLPRWVDSRALGAGVAENYTIPTTIGYVIMSADNGFYFNTNGTASVPGDLSDGSASMYVPSSFEGVVDSSDVISLFAVGATVVTIACYAD